MKFYLKKLFGLGVLALGTLSAAHAFDPNDIQLGNPRLAGSGCRAGTADAVLSDDAKTLSILFDDYVAEAGGSTGRTITRKGCNVAVPVHVPQGFSVSLIDVDYRGFISLPRGAYARLSTSYFFAGQRGPSKNKMFRGGFEDEYVMSPRLIVGALAWSRCGADVILRAKTSLMVKNRNRNVEAIGTVDSIDVQAGIIYKLQWKRCRR